MRDHRRALGAGGIHHRTDVLHPFLRRDGVLDDAVGQSDAAHVEPEHAGVAVHRRDELLDERLLPHCLKMTSPVEDEHDVPRPVADHLVREVNVTTTRVERPRGRHAIFVSQAPPGS